MFTNRKFKKLIESDRYIKRDSPADFIGVFMKYWDNWLNELKELDYCNHIILKQGQFLQDIVRLL